MTHARRPRASGFTIMELLVTMTLAALLLGAGATVFIRMGKRTAHSQALSDVVSIVDRARNASSKFPAKLVIDPKEGTVQGFTDEIVQELHFEPRPTQNGLYWPMGIGGLECNYSGGELMQHGGRVGGAMRLRNGTIDCGDYAAYDVTEGISAEIWVKFEAPGRATLISKGNVFQVRFDVHKNGGGRVAVRLGLYDKGGADRIEPTADVPSAAVGRWMGVRVNYDRNELVTAVDEGWGPVVVGRWPEKRPLARAEDAHLVVGGGTLDGWVDDFRFGGIHAAEPIRMPLEVSLAGVRREIRFVDGRLDPELHAGVERIALVHAGRTTSIEIGQNGTVQRMTYDDSETPDETPPEKRKEPKEPKAPRFKEE